MSKPMTTDGPVPTPSPFRAPTAAPPLSSGRIVAPARVNLAATGRVVAKPVASAASIATPRPAATPAPESAVPPRAKPVPPAAPPSAVRAVRPTPTLDRAQILAATAECLDEKGFEKTTIRTIAKRLNCAVGSIYRYFTDKHELLDAVCQQRFVDVVDAIDAGQGPDDTLRLYHAAAAARPEQYRLMFWLASVGRAPDEPARLPDVIGMIVAAWARQLDDANAARCRWALVHGQLMLDAPLDCELLPDLGLTLGDT